MKDILKRIVVGLIMAISPLYWVWGIETSRQINRIVNRISCELPDNGCFTCSQLGITLPLYIERKEGTILQIGVKLFTLDGRSVLGDVVSNAIERLWLELELCDNVQQQKKMLEEYGVAIVFNGFPLGTTQFSSLANAVDIITAHTQLSMEVTSEGITCLMGYCNNTLVIRLPSDREFLFAYDKKEHEEVLISDLQTWVGGYTPDPKPLITDLEKMNKDVYKLSGKAYLIDSLRQETFYQVESNHVNVLFDRKYPVWSLQNLLMGRFVTDKIDLHVQYRTYEKIKRYCTMSLNDFLGYMQAQGIDLYSTAYTSDQFGLCGLLFMHHPIYNYAHMLIVYENTEIYDDVHVELEGEFHTFIPQHYIKNLLNE